MNQSSGWRSVLIAPTTLLSAASFAASSNRPYINATEARQHNVRVMRAGAKAAPVEDGWI
jgi:hypothetical protein